MDLSNFIFLGSFNFPIRNGMVMFPDSLTKSKYYLELEDIRRYPVVRDFIITDTCYRLELITLDKLRAFIFIRHKDSINLLYFNKQ